MNPSLRYFENNPKDENYKLHFHIYEIIHKLDLMILLPHYNFCYFFHEIFLIFSGVNEKIKTKQKRRL